MLKTFEAILEQIQDELYVMGQKVISANEIALEAITKANPKLFPKAKSELNNISHMSNKIDNMILKALALHQPEARDYVQWFHILRLQMR